MKIEITRGITEFRDIPVGDCCYAQGNYYMKVKNREGKTFAVRLSTGMVEPVKDDDYVMPAKALVKIGVIYDAEN